MKDRLISHSASSESIEKTIQNITARITQQGDKPHASMAYQLGLLLQLSQFDFGRYVLQNQGINGYWTHYMLTHPWFGRKSGLNNRGDKLTDLEDYFLNRAPIMLATQQRFEIFLKENQKRVKNNAKLASVPCGMMGELLYLDYAGIEQIELIGVDYDSEALKDAAHLAREKELNNFVTLSKQDAWQLDFKNELDLISSNGLTIYEPDDAKVTELYRQFYHALNRNGVLVTSFLTPPPTQIKQCEWDMSHINANDLILQKIIFADIVEVKWQSYRSSEQTYTQLKSVGFDQVEFIYDQAKMFPTVVAIKA